MKKSTIKTKSGAASMFVVIFTTMLITIIALSFVRLMISESDRTTNYSLSQSAYNSAMAGIEDAKIVLLRYQNCINNNNHVAGYNCDDYISAFENDESAEDCDLVSRLLGYNTVNNETIIQTQSSSSVSSVGAGIDQAYTCVKISQKSKDYIAKLTQNYQTKIIPIRTKTSAEINSINRVVLHWFSRNDLSSVKNASGAISANYNRMNNPGVNLTNPNPSYSPDGGKYYNSFGEKSAVPPTIQATLVQTAEKFRLSQFYTNSDNNTNRATVTLRPSANRTAPNRTNYSTHITNLAKTANKSFNTPLDVYCNIDDDSWGNGYACNADLVIPRPVGTSTVATCRDRWNRPYSCNQNFTNRNANTMFLVVNLPYSEPETEVNVELKSCTDDNASIFSTNENDDSYCKSVYFSQVQPIVDSTGRANDLFRRVEARIETQDTYFPIANYALAVDDENNKDAGIFKNFYVTRNCFAGNYTFDGNGIPSYGSTSCSNSGVVTGKSSSGANLSGDGE